MADNHEAEVLLQVPNADIDEITRPADAPPNVGTRRTVVHGGELIVLSMTFTPEQLEAARKDLNVSAEVLAVKPGDPVIIVLCGEYRIPLLTTVPIRQSGRLNYVVYVPNITLGINLAPQTQPEVLEAFEFIIKTYGRLEMGAIPSLDNSRAAPMAAAPQVNYQAMPAPLGAQATPAPAGVYQPPPPGMYQAYRPPGQDYQPPVQTHGSLEEQQRAALDAARGQTEYVVPRRYPGSATMLMQTAPDLTPVATSTAIAHGITSIAAKATRIITGGTDLAARGIATGSEHIVANTAPCENPVEVPQTALNTLRTTRVATRGAVAVSGGFATAVLGISSVVSGQIAGRLRNHVPQSREPSALDGVKEVGLATVGAAVAIADATLDGARAMLSASCDGVTKIVTHKLGEQAGQATSDGLGLVQDGVTAASNMRSAGLKSVAAATLKTTAQQTFS